MSLGRSKRLCVDIIKEADAQDALLARLQPSTVFTSRLFLDNLCVDSDLWVVFRGSELICGSLIQVEDGIVVEGERGFAKYQGLLVGSHVKTWSADQYHFHFLPCAALLLHSVEHHYKHGLTLSIAPSINDMRPFQWAGMRRDSKTHWEIFVRYTAVVYLTKADGFEGYLKRVRGSVRQSNRYARERGFEIDHGRIEEVLFLYRLSLKRQGAAPSETFIATLRALGHNAQKMDFGESLIIRSSDGHLVSGLFMLYDECSAYLMAAGTDPDWRSSPASAALWLDGIRRCLARGITAIDLLVANNPGRCGFKTGFAPRITPYFEAVLNSTCAFESTVVGAPIGHRELKEVF